MRELDILVPKNGHIENVLKFSSTYYFLSRVVNAQLTKLEGGVENRDMKIR
ncbi:MAG: hypothetical protein LBL17_02435 [Coxiellaceae bacterium]|nr:hypothetical protein [Coxiellaceae bacterium]